MQKACPGRWGPDSSRTTTASSGSGGFGDDDISRHLRFILAGMRRYVFPAWMRCSAAVHEVDGADPQLTQAVAAVKQFRQPLPCKVPVGHLTQRPNLNTYRSSQT